MTRVILDLEANGLDDATKVWCIVTKDIDTNEVRVFEGQDLQDGFGVYSKDLTLVIGHNVICYDLPTIRRILDVRIECPVFDTLVVSRLLDVGREGGHSLDNWGEILNYPKTIHQDFSKYTEEMKEYCKNDVELNHKVYQALKKIIDRNPGVFDQALSVEHDMQRICNDMRNDGFYFDIEEAKRIDKELEERIKVLDDKIQHSFPPKVETIQLKTKVKTVVTPFNPGSPKQIVDRLWDAGWQPVEKTKTHAKAKKPTDRDRRYGWKVNEVNVSTLPSDAPEGCKHLVEHILLSARRRTLKEWFDAYSIRDQRIHGTINPLGARSHRCTHSNPNTGNIAAKKSIKYSSDKLRQMAVDLGGRMRSLWRVPPGSFLVGVDMEGAHLRIFAHLVNDAKFIEALVNGKKEDGTDPHSVNKRILGDTCVDRDRAKTFIFTFLNGGGAGKVSEIFGCSVKVAQEALSAFTRAYPGLARLKRNVFPRDAKRGYFVGIDGRYVKCDSEHLMTAMVLQNAEALVMKYSMVMFKERMKTEHPNINWFYVGFVHDEVLCEVKGTKDEAELCGRIMSECIRDVGVKFKFKCPLAGEYKVATDWLGAH